MTTAQRAYSSTVVSPGLAGASVVLGAALSTWIYFVAPGSPIGPLAGIVVAVSGIYLATVRLAVGAERIVLGQGPWPRPGRVIPMSLVTEVHTESLTLSQVFGFGLAWHPRTTRMTVRPGPVLASSLSTGEYIRISTRDPDAAVAVIRSAQPGSQPEDSLAAGIQTREEGLNGGDQQARRPWFGPKRIGFGVRPQTWQGWLIVVVIIAAIVILGDQIH